MFYITNARIGGYYFRDAMHAEHPERSGFRVRHEDASGFETEAAALAVIDSDKLVFAGVAFFAPEQVAAIEAKKVADIEVHEERAALAAEHFAANQRGDDPPAP